MRPWERRLRDLGQLLTNCGATYFDPEIFRLNTNQFLQTSRTVTFIVQRNKTSIPDFDAWYQRNILTPWATDPVMTWAKDSRNVIEKEGDLDLHSSVRVTLLFSYLSFQDIVLTNARRELLAADVKRLIRFARTKLPTGVSADAALKLERRWVANSLPERELVYAMTYVYARLYEACSSLARHLGLQISGEVPVPTRLDPASNDVGCIRYLKLSDPGLSRLAYIPVNADKDFKPPPALVALCNELRGESRPTNLPQAVEYLARVAKFTFEHHGNHVPMLFLLIHPTLVWVTGAGYRLRPPQWK